MRLFKGIGASVVSILAFQAIQAVTVELPENPTRPERFFAIRLTSAITNKASPTFAMGLRHCDDCELSESLPAVSYFKDWLTNSISKVVIERTDPESMTEHLYEDRLVRESLPVEWLVTFHLSIPGVTTNRLVKARAGLDTMSHLPSTLRSPLIKFTIGRYVEKYRAENTDTLESIASRFSMKTNKLQGFNPKIDFQNLQAGQLITVYAQPSGKPGS